MDSHPDVPAQFAVALAAEQKIFDGFVTAGRRMRAAGDRDGLRVLADAMRERQEQALTITGGWLRRVTDRVAPALADIYDGAFPPPATARLDDLASVADALDGPWPTPRRAALIMRLAVEASADPAHLPMFTAIAEAVVAAPPSDSRDRAARLLIGSPHGYVDRVVVSRLLTVLHESGRLDADVVLRAHLADHQLGSALGDSGPGDSGGDAVIGGGGHDFAGSDDSAAAVREHLDEILWRVTAVGDVTAAPDGYRPHGLRFVFRGLALEATGFAADATAPTPSVVVNMCRAVLTPDEVTALGDELATRPLPARRAGFAHRWAVGDSDGLLRPLDFAEAAPLYALMRAASADVADDEAQGRPAHHPFRCDAAAVRDAIAACGAKQARELLDLAGDATVAEEFGAVAGWNAASVRKRFSTHALVAIAAYGLLPLAGGETVTDRFRTLRASAARAATFLGDRRRHHLAAIDLALDHLAQIGGYPDRSELELDMEAMLGATTRTSWAIGDYTIRLDTSTAELRIARSGRDLASVPTIVRRSADYGEARACQEALREQRRRMRNGLLERLVGTGAPLDAERLALLLRTPAGAALLPGVVWRAASGVTGLLSGADHLVDARGERHPVDGPLTAVHPVNTTAQDLARWQHEVVRRRVVQPVKQLFREVYVPTPAELSAGVESARFAGHVVAGNVAARLLSDRGWLVDHAATGPAPITRRFGDVEACLRADHRDRIGHSDVTLETVHFTRDGARLRVDRVPDIVFSEVMRDLALVVGVAGRRVDATAAGLYERAALLGALVADLGLDRVSVEGHTALVHGERADYRVHLGSGAVQATSGSYLWDVPAREVFLPYSDEDPLTRTVLGKVLTLADDAHITDPALLAQLSRSSGPTARAA